MESAAMGDTRLATGHLRFGVFEVDFHARDLRKRGMRIRVEEKPFQILELLLERPGEMVTRKILRERLWPETFVSYDHNLNTAVTKLRELLGDSARSPRFIETVPRRGYRFIAPVEKPTQAIAKGKTIVAVLPFEDLSGDRDQEAFVDALTEEMISQLSRLSPKRIGIIARTSAVQYKGSKKSIAEIAAELNVEYILEGSVRRQGECVRISAQLVEAQDQTHLWSATFDRELRDALSAQEDVARRVGEALAFELLPDQRPTLLAGDSENDRA
jgi:TolB-like protein